MFDIAGAVDDRNDEKMRIVGLIDYDVIANDENAGNVAEIRSPYAHQRVLRGKLQPIEECGKKSIGCRFVLRRDPAPYVPEVLLRLGTEDIGMTDLAG